MKTRELDLGSNRLIETWDVLKLTKTAIVVVVGGNMGCIEMVHAVSRIHI